MANARVVEVEAIVTGSRPMTAYGGVRLSDEALETIAARLRAQDVPMVLHHDPTRPLRAEVVDAEVRSTADGFKEVWVKFIADEVQWHAYEKELSTRGAPGGFSFSCSEPLAQLSGVEGATGRFELAADAAHWSDTELLDAANVLRTLGTVSVGRRYAFAHEPVAVVVFTLIVMPFAVNLLSSAAYDALKRFLRPTQTSVFHFRIRRGDDFVEARLETDRDDVLQRALEAFDQLSQPKVPYRWHEKHARWREIDTDGATREVED